MPETTRQPERRGAPARTSSSTWRKSYAELGGLQASVVAELSERGLSAATARDYAALAMAAEGFCRERHTTALTAPQETLGLLAATLGLHRRGGDELARGAQAISILRDRASV